MSHEAGESTYTQNVCVRFQKQINTIAVDRNGEHCVLGGKKSLYVIKLEDPNELAKTISNPSSKWDINLIEWNPHSAKSSLIASAANQEAHIWDSAEGRLVTTIPPHQRAVSDIGWSPYEPNVLVTSSLDSNINLWDVRDPNRALSMKKFSKYNGALQAKWNRRNSNLLASAHEGMIFIWDIRKEGQPMASITAHNTQIYGIDWSYLNANDIISCSQDKMVKLWSIDNPRECKMVIQTGTPVLRAKYLPFGSGIVTVAERGNYLLRLWSIKDPTTPPTVPIHAFMGHSDVIRSFDWRFSRPTEDAQRLDAIQMLSWSKDQSLRFWCFDNSHLAACGIYASPQPSHRRGSVYYFGDLPPDSPTVDAKYPRQAAFGSVLSPHFDASSKATNLHTGLGVQDTVYMGDSLGEGYFGGMEDMLEGHSDEGEEFRKSLLHVSTLQGSMLGRDAEGREEISGDADQTEALGDWGGEYKGRAGRRASQGDLGLLSNSATGGRVRAGGDETRPFPAVEDQGLIPGDLEHEFVLLKKKKFPGITIVQANAAQRTCVIHVTEGDQQHEERKFQLKITFPSLYPHNASPSFEISDIDSSAAGNRTAAKQNTSILATTPPNTGITAFSKAHLTSPLSPAAARANTRFLENLKRIAEMRVSHNMPCIESCLIKLVALLKEDEKLIWSQIRQKSSPMSSPRTPRTDDENKGIVGPEKVAVGLAKPGTSFTNISGSPVQTPILSLPHAGLPQPTAPSQHSSTSSVLTTRNLDTSTAPSRARAASLAAPVITTPFSSTTVRKQPSIDLIIDETVDLELVPHIPVVDIDEQNKVKPLLPEEFAEGINFPLADFDTPADNGLLSSLGVDTIDSNIENSAPDTKVVRSKSTIELRNTMNGVSARLEAVGSSTVSSPGTPPQTSLAGDKDVPVPTIPITVTASTPEDPSSTATTAMRRTRSMGGNRFSVSYQRDPDAIAMNIPSPRICSVAISPTGKLVYFQTLHCRNPVLQQSTNPSETSPRTASLDSPSSGRIEEPRNDNTNSSSITEGVKTPSEESLTDSVVDQKDGQADSAQHGGILKSKGKLLDLKDKLKRRKPKKPQTSKGDSKNEAEDRTTVLTTLENTGADQNHNASDSDTCSDASDDSDSDSNSLETDEERGTHKNNNNSENTIHSTINSIIINKDTKTGVNFTLPFFGVFPRTFPELSSILSSRKLVNQYTTGDTATLAQLKSLNSLRVSTKIYITDISHLMPSTVQLAANYQLLGNLQEICAHNQAVARQCRRPDLVKVWKTLSVLCNPLAYGRPFNPLGSSHVSYFRDPWVALPIARNLVSALYKHYEAVGDVQTLAMISCVLLQSKYNLRASRKRHISSEEENEISLLDPKKEPIALSYRQIYGEILSKWGLLVKRAELLKHAYGGHQHASTRHSYSPGSYIPPPHRGVTFGVICSSCDRPLKDGFFCASCKTFGFKCAICNLSVKGLSNFCILCGHGGHANHMSMWFQRETYCPAGCNCQCIFEGEASDPAKVNTSAHPQQDTPSTNNTRDKDSNDTPTKESDPGNDNASINPSTVSDNGTSELPGPLKTDNMFSAIQELGSGEHDLGDFMLDSVHNTPPDILDNPTHHTYPDSDSGSEPDPYAPYDTHFQSLIRNNNTRSPATSHRNPSPNPPHRTTSPNPPHRNPSPNISNRNPSPSPNRIPSPTNPHTNIISNFNSNFLNPNTNLPLGTSPNLHITNSTKYNSAEDFLEFF